MKTAIVAVRQCLLKTHLYQALSLQMTDFMNSVTQVLLCSVTAQVRWLEMFFWHKICNRFSCILGRLKSVKNHRMITSCNDLILCATRPEIKGQSISPKIIYSRHRLNIWYHNVLFIFFLIFSCLQTTDTHFTTHTTPCPPTCPCPSAYARGCTARTEGAKRNGRKKRPLCPPPMLHRPSTR